jgi:serine protease Do
LTALALMLANCWPATAAANKPTSAAADLCGWIGVRTKPMTAAFAGSLGMAVPYGAIFARPTPGSPAAKAGIEAYDVITAVNGVPLQSSSGFTKITSSMAPGTRVYLTTWRNRQMIEVDLVLRGAKCSRS